MVVWYTDLSIMNQMKDINIYNYLCISLYCSDGNCHEYYYIFNSVDNKCFHFTILQNTLTILQYRKAEFLYIIYI